MSSKTSTQPLAKRIAIALAVMVGFVAATYCFALWYAITQTEEVLIGQRMQLLLDKAVAESRTDQGRLGRTLEFSLQLPKAGGERSLSGPASTVGETLTFRFTGPADRIFSENFSDKINDPEPDTVKLMGLATKLNTALPFYTIYGDGPGTMMFPGIPKQFKFVSEGFSEVLGESDFFVFKRTEGPDTWVVVQDQMGFETIEEQIYLRAFLGLFLASAAAAAIGWWLSHTVTEPVRELAREVRAMAEGEEFTPLTRATTNDEISELAVELENSYRKLHQALSREKSFTADVSHELRTPLTAISTSAELLSLSDNESVRRQADRIMRSCQRLHKLVRVFLALARGSTQASFSETESIGEAAGNSIENWQAAATGKKLDLTLKLLDKADKTVDATLTESLIDNLLRNAVQYTESGKIELIVGNSSITVRDTGRGISSEDCEKITQAFVRGTNADGEGYGWGLSLVSRICAHENWRLEISRNEVAGCTFRILF